MLNILNDAISAIINVVVVGILGFIIARMKKISKIDKARVEIDKCIARRDIFDAYEDYIIRGKSISVSRYDELESEFKAYLELGGNGTAKKYMEEICKTKKPFLVID